VIIVKTCSQVLEEVSSRLASFKPPSPFSNTRATRSQPRLFTWEVEFVEILILEYAERRDLKSIKHSPRTRCHFLSPMHWKRGPRWSLHSRDDRICHVYFPYLLSIEEYRFVLHIVLFKPSANEIRRRAAIRCQISCHCQTHPMAVQSSECHLLPRIHLKYSPTRTTCSPRPGFKPA